MDPEKAWVLVLEEALQLGAKTIVKIDGDNQFKSEDIKNLLQLADKINLILLNVTDFGLGVLRGIFQK